MTKYEAIMSYTNAQKRDSWIALGQAQIDTTSKTFIKNSIFRLVVAGVPLNGALFFVKEDFTVDPLTYNWANYTLSDPVKGTIAETHAITHPYLYCILSNADFAAITDPFDPNFIPFQGADESVIIDDLELENILFEVGVPFITLEELEYSRETILRNCVLPAMKEYFKWFPIIEIGVFPMGAGGKFEIDIPEYAYTAQRVYLVPGFGLDVNSQNPFYRSWAQSNTGFGVGTTFGNPHDRSLRGRKRYQDIQGFNTYVLEKAARQGAINYGKRTRIRVNIQKKKVTGFLNQIGSLEVEWAVMSNDWEDIPFNRRLEARDLAKAYILRGLAMLRDQSPKDVPGVIDTSKFLQRALELEAPVIENWRSATKAVAIRS